jgi:hypothetical protein
LQRPSGPIKMEGSTCAFRVENVSWKLILIIDLNHFHIFGIFIIFCNEFAICVKCK